MSPEIEGWLDRTAKLRNALMAYAKTSLPIEQVSRIEDMDKLIRAEDEQGVLLADATQYLIQEQARAILLLKDKYPDFNSRERERMEKAEVAGLQRLVHGLEITAKTLSNRRYALMNQSRSR